MPIDGGSAVLQRRKRNRERVSQINAFALDAACPTTLIMKPIAPILRSNTLFII